MLSFPVEIRFWTLDDNIIISDTDLGAFRYYEKKEEKNHITSVAKKLYAESRGYKWHISNKRPTKLRDCLKEFEDTVKYQKIVLIKWFKQNSVLICLNTGIKIAIGVSLNTGDIINITCDKFIQDKLLADDITDCLLTSTFSLFCYNNQLSLLHFTKSSIKKSYKKLAHLDPKIYSCELPGPNTSGRRLHRKLAKNKTGDIIAVWWKCSNDEIYPWSPVVKEIDRANVYFYTIIRCKLELLCYYRTEYDPLCFTFSGVESNVLYSVEQKISRTGDISAESNTYEIVKYSRLHKVNSCSVPLQSSVSCAEYSPDHSNLLIGCIDGSLVLYNQIRSLTHLIKAAFVPVIVKWHPDGNIAVIGSEKGQLQCFDFALGCIKMQIISEDVTPSSVIDLSTYFRKQPVLQEIKWCEKLQSADLNGYEQNSSFIILGFEYGPLALIRILGSAVVIPDLLVCQYLNANQIDRAVNLLLALDWDTRPPECFSILKQIVSHILSFPPNSLCEKQSLLQIALCSFYSPIQSINQSVEAEYSKRIRDISRRIFYHLLRNNLFDDTYKIAAMLNEHDLYMDIYYAAKNVGNLELATTAWKRAELICNEGFEYSSTETSDCSCSESTSQENTSDYNAGCSGAETLNNNLKENSLSLQRLPSSHSLYSSYASVTHLPPSYSIAAAVTGSTYLPAFNNHNFSSNLNSPQSSSLLKQGVRFLKTKSNIIDKSPSVKSDKGSSVNAPSEQLNLENNIEEKTSQHLNITGVNGAVFPASENKSIKVIHFGVV